MGKGNAVHRYFHYPQGRAHSEGRVYKSCNVCVVVGGLVTVSQHGIRAVVGVGLTHSQPSSGQRLSGGRVTSQC